MIKHFIFCHGFGFDNSFWENLSPFFLNEKCTYLESGYFGDNPTVSPASSETRLIGIGHSLGIPKLLSLNINFDYLIGLNSFINFLGTAPDLRKKRQQELYFLKNQLQKSPISTMQDFYQRCGVPMENGKVIKINTEMLLKELDFLTESVSIPQASRVLMLGAKDDVIVPPEILYDNFEKLTHVSIRIVDHGKHGLGFLKAEEIKTSILNFINDSN